MGFPNSHGSVKRWWKLILKSTSTPDFNTFTKILTEMNCKVQLLRNIAAEKCSLWMFPCFKQKQTKFASEEKNVFLSVTFQISPENWLFYNSILIHTYRSPHKWISRWSPAAQSSFHRKSEKSKESNEARSSVVAAPMWLGVGWYGDVQMGSL